MCNTVHKKGHLLNLLSKAKRHFVLNKPMNLTKKFKRPCHFKNKKKLYSEKYKNIEDSVFPYFHNLNESVYLNTFRSLIIF